MALENPNEFNDDGISVLIDYEGPVSAEPDAASAVTPGAVVEFTTNENECQEAGAGSTKAFGYAGPNVRADDPAEGTESDLRTDYAAGERVNVRNNYGDKFWGILADQAGVDVEPGTLLKTAANGTLTPLASADNADVKAVAELLGTDARAPNGSTARAPVRWIA